MVLDARQNEIEETILRVSDKATGPARPKR